eukprot:m.666294 g.666294  ORF g.666294 m.666294 type:complete len:682 (-) comp22749_c2_seq1:145-2190(-)
MEHGHPPTLVQPTHSTQPTTPRFVVACASVFVVVLVAARTEGPRKSTEPATTTEGKDSFIHVAAPRGGVHDTTNTLTTSEYPSGYGSFDHTGDNGRSIPVVLPNIIGKALPLFQSTAVSSIVAFFEKEGVSASFKVFVNTACWNSWLAFERSKRYHGARAEFFNGNTRHAWLVATLVDGISKHCRSPASRTHQDSIDACTNPRNAAETYLNAVYDRYGGRQNASWMDAWVWYGWLLGHFWLMRGCGAVVHWCLVGEETGGCYRDRSLLTLVMWVRHCKMRRCLAIGCVCVHSISRVPMTGAMWGRIREDFHTAAIGSKPFCFNPVSLAPVQDTGNPWREMLDIWNQKFAAEAYLPVALALSTWSTTDASAANASVVVQWLNCLDNTLMQRQHCATKLLPGTALLPDAKPRFHIETHDFANCYWMADKRRHMHLRDCATVSSRSDDEPKAAPWNPAYKLQNYGVTEAGKDVFAFNASRDIVIPTSNGFVSPRPPPGSPMELLHHELNTIEASGGFTAVVSQRTILAVSVTGSPSPAREMLFPLNTSEIVILRHCDPAYALGLYRRSRYCIQADGNAPWSPRLVQYILLGCVPVIVSDTLAPPFATTLNWTTFSITVPLFDIATLPRRMREANHTELHSNLLLVRQFFQYRLDIFPTNTKVWDSALPLIMYEMWRRTDHAHPL